VHPPYPAGRERGDPERATTLLIHTVVRGFWSPLPQVGGGAGEREPTHQHTYKRFA
jgi:hypothetical protein